MHLCGYNICELKKSLDIVLFIYTIFKVIPIEILFLLWTLVLGCI